MTTTAIILAGGLGTRLKAAVPDLPKPMAPINGRPFLEYQLDYWIGQGVSRFVLSGGSRRDSIMSHFGARYNGAHVEYAVEETPLGTGGGLLQAAQMVPKDQRFLVLNGDTFFDVPLMQLKQIHATYRSGWTIALFKADAPDRYGKITLAADGAINAFSSEKAAPGDYANGGIYLLSPDALAGFEAGKPASLEQDILPTFIARGGRCFGMPHQGQFFDIGLPHDYYNAANILTVR